MSSLLLKKEYQQDEDIEYDLRSDDPEEQSIATVDIRNYEDPLEPPNRADSLTPEIDRKDREFGDKQRNLSVVAIINFADGIKFMMQQTWEDSYKLGGMQINDWTNQKNTVLDSLYADDYTAYTQKLIEFIQSPSSDTHLIIYEIKQFIGTVHRILYDDIKFDVQYIYGIDKMIGFFHQNGFLYENIPYYGFICDILCVPIYTLLSKTEFYDQYLLTISDSHIINNLDTRSIIHSAKKKLSNEFKRPETIIKLSQNDPSFIEKISNCLCAFMKFRVTDTSLNDVFLEIVNNIHENGYDSQSISLEITKSIASKIVNTENIRRLDDSIVGFKWMTIDVEYTVDKKKVVLVSTTLQDGSTLETEEDVIEVKYIVDKKKLGLMVPVSITLADGSILETEEMNIKIKYTGDKKDIFMLPALIFVEIFKNFFKSKPILDKRTFTHNLRQYLAVNYVLRYINRNNIKYIESKISSLYTYYNLDKKLVSDIAGLLRNYI